MNRHKYLQASLDFFRLIRPTNLIIIAFTQYMVLFFLIGGVNDIESYLIDYQQFKLTLSTVLIAAGGYIINDYFDIKIDLINKPQAVIIGRSISRRWAMVWHQIISFVAICLAFSLGINILLINIFAALLLWLYAAKLKKVAFVGNFLVALLSAVSLLIMAVYYEKNVRLIFIYAVFAFSISIIREIIKDMEDVRGDARFGCQTLPIIWGFRRTKFFVLGLIVGFAVILLALLQALHNTRLFLFFILFVPILCYLFYKLYWADKKRDFHYLSVLCKQIMLFGILSMIFV